MDHLAVTALMPVIENNTKKLESMSSLQKLSSYNLMGICDDFRRPSLIHKLHKAASFILAIKGRHATCNESMVKEQYIHICMNIYIYLLKY